MTMAKKVFPISRRASRQFQKAVRASELDLRKACESLVAEAAAGRALSPGAAWLVDNYMFVHGQARELKEALPPGFYRLLERASGTKDEPRVRGIADDLLVSTNGDPSGERVRSYLRSYQQSTPLTLAELWALEPLLKFALIRTLAQAAAPEARNQDGAEAVIRGAITALRTMESYPWKDVVESVCLADRILRRDPAGAYDRMDFTTRDKYRQRVEQLSRGSRHREEQIAEMALELARAEAEQHGADSRGAHVGYFLLGSGRGRLRARARYRRGIEETLLEWVRRWPNFCYLGAIAAVTAVLLGAAWRLMAPLPWWYLALLAIPVSQAALSAVNRIVHVWVPPHRLPRLDFSDGIPDDGRTFVVVPTLLLSRKEVEKLLERLEIHYLANRDPNLLFALLTDFPDSQKQEGDAEVLAACVAGIRILNRRYAQEGRSPFYLFHRGSEWNESEKVWMGRERKRGKLNDFNDLLRGKRDAFEAKVGDLAVLPTVRYVLTLDSDTQLPRDTARDLVATMAHPLNRPEIDPQSGIVREGFGLLQPRVSVSMESTAKSRLAQLYGGQPGFDPYTTAISDVYQDLHGQASFTGKGLYDVAIFEQVMEGRFPDNTLLSHDLIEGEHTRVGLVTELEVVDDFPSTYESFCKRKHRWVRGDWQIIQWLLARVPNAAGQKVRNPLWLASRWKILDNLRRSVVELVLAVLLCAGWFGAVHGSLRVTLAAAAIYLLPVYVDLLFGLVRLPPVRFWRSYFRELLFRFGQGHQGPSSAARNAARTP